MRYNRDDKKNIPRKRTTMSQDITMSAVDSNDISLPTNNDMAGDAHAEGERVIFASPGVTRGRKIGSGIFLALLCGFSIAVAIDQGASVVVSTIIAAIFILGFVGYLKIIAPPPFRMIFDPDTLRREEQGMERIEIPWANVVKVKEERFPNDLPISMSLYKRVGAKGLHRAFIVYRDDLPGFEQFLVELKRRVPAETRWNIEIVHE
jgi:hypothetical protein